MFLFFFSWVLYQLILPRSIILLFLPNLHLTLPIQIPSLTILLSQQLFSILIPHLQRLSLSEIQYLAQQFPVPSTFLQTELRNHKTSHTPHTLLTLS